MTGAHPFDENWVSDSDSDPLDGHGCEHFDFDQVCCDIDGEAAPADLAAEERELQVAFLRELFSYCLKPLERPSAANQYALTVSEKIGRRLIALAWVTNPDLFEGGPSLTELSRRMGITPPILSVLTREASNAFGIVNRAQSHDPFKRKRKAQEQPKNTNP